MVMGGQMEAGWKEGIVAMLECISSHAYLFSPTVDDRVWWSRGLDRYYFEARKTPMIKELKKEFFPTNMKT
jgi:hypothetical protein